MIMAKDLVVMFIGTNKKLKTMSATSISIISVILFLISLLGVKLMGKFSKQYPEKESAFLKLKILYKLVAAALFFLSFFAALVVIFEKIK